MTAQADSGATENRSAASSDQGLNFEIEVCSVRRANSFLIQTPLGSLILMATSLILFRAGRPLAWGEATFLLVPVLIFYRDAAHSFRH